jgi:hypothetical protein
MKWNWNCSVSLPFYFPILRAYVVPESVPMNLSALSCLSYRVGHGSSAANSMYSSIWHSDRPQIRAQKVNLQGQPLPVPEPKIHPCPPSPFPVLVPVSVSFPCPCPGCSRADLCGGCAILSLANIQYRRPISCLVVSRRCGTALRLDSAVLKPRRLDTSLVVDKNMHIRDISLFTG